MGLVACQSAAPEPSAGTEQAARAVVVEGWDCADAATCFGLHVGRSHLFERRVGPNAESESWLITDAFEDEGKQLFIQDGGPEQYQLDARELSFTIRGELLPAMRFPVRPGDSFSVDSTQGQTVVMSVLRYTEVQSPAGEFARCLVHQARFQNTEINADGLVVETTFCEGVGEVAQQIKLSAAPLPVDFTLLAREPELLGDASGLDAAEEVSPSTIP
jgi:hypothetical protein